jgi:hypothetical protein
VGVLPSHRRRNQSGDRRIAPAGAKLRLSSAGQGSKRREKMTESQKKWDKEHMKTVSCRLDRKTAEDFSVDEVRIEGE